MNYYNPNFYQNFQPQQQYYQQPVPQVPFNSLQNSGVLNGKIVDSEEVVKATEVPIGGYGIFPKADLSEIYIKSWNSNGTSSLSVASCDDDAKTIYINNQLQGNFLKKVLCHEITHAAMFSYDVNLTIDQEELIADLIATYGDEIIYITNIVFEKVKGEWY